MKRLIRHFPCRRCNRNLQNKKGNLRFSGNWEHLKWRLSRKDRTVSGKPNLNHRVTIMIAVGLSCSPNHHWKRVNCRNPKSRNHQARNSSLLWEKAWQSSGTFMKKFSRFNQAGVTLASKTSQTREKILLTHKIISNQTISPETNRTAPPSKEKIKRDDPPQTLTWSKVKFHYVWNNRWEIVTIGIWLSLNQ